MQVHKDPSLENDYNIIRAGIIIWEIWEITVNIYRFNPPGGAGGAGDLNYL